MTITLPNLVSDVRQAVNNFVSEPSEENFRRVKTANISLKRECMGRNGEEARQAFENLSVAFREGRTADATQAAQRFASAVSAEFPESASPAPAASPSVTPEAPRTSSIRRTVPAAASTPSPSTPEVTDGTSK